MRWFILCFAAIGFFASYRIAPGPSLTESGLLGHSRQHPVERRHKLCGSCPGSKTEPGSYVWSTQPQLEDPLLVLIGVEDDAPPLAVQAITITAWPEEGTALFVAGTSAKVEQRRYWRWRRVDWQQEDWAETQLQIWCAKKSCPDAALIAPNRYRIRVPHETALITVDQKGRVLHLDLRYEDPAYPGRLSRLQLWGG